MNERRSSPRRKFALPIGGSVGSARVRVIDASLAGLGVEHEDHLPPPGGICRLALFSESGPIHVDCAIVRTVAQNAEAVAKGLFRTGLQVLSADFQSRQRLQALLLEKK